MIPLRVNGRTWNLDIAPDTPVLWALRDHIGLPGTRYGCGVAACGACTVHLDGDAVRSCVLPVSAAAGKEITTIEGLSASGDHPLQDSWRRVRVPQCGYCQSGQIMSAAALLRKHRQPTDEQIDTAMEGNLCRCGTYVRIRKAIHLAAQMMASGKAANE